MSNRYKRVLVTGGAGCIGMAVCKLLHESGSQVILFDLYEQISMVEKDVPDGIEIYSGSVLDESSIRGAIKGCDAVIHLAAHLGVRRTELNSLRCLDININGTKNVLDSCVLSGIKKIIFASSSEVYGEPLTNPVMENNLTQGKSVYAISKLAGEELVKAYANEYGNLRYTCLRYFNTYGPYQIAQFVIPKFIRNVLTDNSPIIYGDGSQQRSYCFSTDTARATISALFTDKADREIINIGNSNTLISLIELAELVIELCGKGDNVNIRVKNGFAETDRSSQREINVRYCNTSKARDVLGFEPRISLRDGLKRVIEHGVIHTKWATADRNYMIDE